VTSSPSLRTSSYLVFAGLHSFHHLGSYSKLILDGWGFEFWGSKECSFFFLFQIHRIWFYNYWLDLNSWGVKKSSLFFLFQIIEFNSTTIGGFEFLGSKKSSLFFLFQIIEYNFTTIGGWDILVLSFNRCWLGLARSRFKNWTFFRTGPGGSTWTRTWLTIGPIGF